MFTRKAMFNSVLKLIVQFLLLCTYHGESITVSGQSQNEPTCYSRWDYEYKTLKQMVNLETKDGQLETLVNAQNDVIKALRDEIRVIKDQVMPRSVYIRWGRNECSGPASVVYKGYTAGKHYNQPGSGSDTICLPEHPTWGNYTDGDESFPRSLIYGTEIDVNEPSNVFPYRVWEQDIPCVVCMASRSVVTMVPGMVECFPDWHQEYTGYLMSGNPTHHGSYNHVCVDGAPQFLPNGGKDNNEHILYLVQTVCGSLPCPPYVQGRELACVVCSK